MKTAKELEEMFGVTAEQLDEWEKEAAQGILPGEQVGEIIVGRPSSEHRSMYSYVRLSIDRCTLRTSELTMYSTYVTSIRCTVV